MKDIAIVKLVKNMFGKIFGAEGKSEEVLPENEAPETAETTKSKTKDVAADIKNAPVKKKEAAKKKAAPKKKESVPEKKSTAKKKTPEAKKKTVAQKTIDKKTVDKKTVIKKAAGKSAEKKTVNTAPKGTKKAEKIALYTKALKKQYGEVDKDFLAIIVKNLGPSIYKKNAELIFCSEPKELNTVRENFLIKKLGLKEDKKVLDAAIQEVCEELKDTSKKYRALFYYRLAKKFKKESALS